MIGKPQSETFEKSYVEHGRDNLLLNSKLILFHCRGALTCMQENPRQLVKIGLPVSVMDVQSLALKGVAHLAVDVFPNRIGVTGVFNCEAE